MRNFYNSSLSAGMKAFLDTIAYAEGTNGSDGYRTLFGGGLFDNNFVDHPRKTICRPSGKKSICSTAAGRYQILSKTWDGVRSKIKAQDFSPKNQDLAAVKLIEMRKASNDVESGNIKEALEKCSKEWASLPGSPYGQPTKSMDELLNIYQASLMKYNGVPA